MQDTAAALSFLLFSWLVIYDPWFLLDRSDVRHSAVCQREPSLPLTSPSCHSCQLCFFSSTVKDQMFRSVKQPGNKHSWEMKTRNIDKSNCIDK